MFVFYMRSKLDLYLKASKFTGLLKGDRMGTIQNVITSLEERNKDVSETPKTTIPSQIPSKLEYSQQHTPFLLNVFIIPFWMCM